MRNITASIRRKVTRYIWNDTGDKLDEVVSEDALLQVDFDIAHDIGIIHDQIMIEVQEQYG